MPLSLAFRFLTGRYHATPFGHHVNEGLIEWPPSPWRLLRALISVGYTSGAWNGAGPPPAARTLIERLSADLPRYFVPRAVGAHSRHYMPVGVVVSRFVSWDHREYLSEYSVDGLPGMTEQSGSRPEPAGLPFP